MSQPPKIFFSLVDNGQHMLIVIHDDPIITIIRPHMEPTHASVRYCMYRYSHYEEYAPLPDGKYGPAYIYLYEGPA